MLDYVSLIQMMTSMITDSPKEYHSGFIFIQAKFIMVAILMYIVSSPLNLGFEIKKIIYIGITFLKSSFDYLQIGYEY